MIRVPRFSRISHAPSLDVFQNSLRTMSLARQGHLSASAARKVTEWLRGFEGALGKGLGRPAMARYFDAHGARTIGTFTGSSFVDFSSVFGFCFGFISVAREQSAPIRCCTPGNPRSPVSELSVCAFIF